MDRVAGWVNSQYHLVAHTHCHCLRKMEVVRLWCILLDNGPNNPFFVKIGLDELVVDVKEMIRSSLNLQASIRCSRYPVV